MKTSTNTADANSVGSTAGSACSTRERKWRIRISDCYCEYEYELNARANDVSIHDLYELVRERLRANDVHGRFVDPEENSPRMPEPPTVGVPPLAPGSVTYALFKHMADEHGLTLLESEITEIVRVVNDTLEERLRWWIANAEGIAQERGELFRAGEAMRAVMVGHAWDGEEVGAWDASAQPMRDMIADHSQNNRSLPAAEPARCENCGKPAVRLTEDGINLCRECYALCPEDTQNNVI